MFLAVRRLEKCNHTKQYDDKTSIEEGSVGMDAMQKLQFAGHTDIYKDAQRCERHSGQYPYYHSLPITVAIES